MEATFPLLSRTPISPILYHLFKIFLVSSQQHNILEAAILILPPKTKRNMVSSVSQTDSGFGKWITWFA
jgi:hypothetical protein